VRHHRRESVYNLVKLNDVDKQKTFGWLLGFQARCYNLAEITGKSFGTMLNPVTSTLRLDALLEMAVETVATAQMDSH